MAASPPCPTFASRQLARVLPLAGVRSRLSSWLLALAMATTAILSQYYAQDGASIVLLYLLLTAQSVWFLGARQGLMLSMTTVIVGGMAEHSVATEMQGVMVQACNIVSRLLSVGLLGFVLAGLRRTLEIEQWRASTDRVTGALNRNAFDELLGPVIRRAELREEALVLAYMDLDGFKAVNDRYGHSAGDAVLTRFAAGAAAALRSSDVFARIGGDEFAAMLTVPSCLEGDHLAEILHRRLSAILAGTGYDVTVSMGALVMEARLMGREDSIIEQADRLMYIAKESGKNGLHIGRGGTLDAVLRSAFPVAPTPRDMEGMLNWVDRADAPLRRTG